MRIVVVGAVLAALALLPVAAGCGGESELEEARAVLNDARDAYEAEAESGRDFSDGPCIANPLPDREDWVVVVVREPRDQDRSAADRCSAYRDGTAEHFVELDEFGHVIRAQ